MLCITVNLDSRNQRSPIINSNKIIHLSLLSLVTTVQNKVFSSSWSSSVFPLKIMLFFFEHIIYTHVCRLEIWVFCFFSCCHGRYRVSGQLIQLELPGDIQIKQAHFGLKVLHSDWLCVKQYANQNEEMHTIYEYISIACAIRYSKSISGVS